MNRAILVALAIVLLATPALIAQSDMGPDAPCGAAAKWHTRAALMYSERDDQAYHLGAATAALQANDIGADCTGWENDARAPDYEGNRNADSWESAHDALVRP